MKCETRMVSASESDIVPTTSCCQKDQGVEKSAADVSKASPLSSCPTYFDVLGFPVAVSKWSSPRYQSLLASCERE